MHFELDCALKYKRWRHSRGYGVHSPFGFSVIENVVRPGKYAYYGYGRIDSASKNKKERDRARFLLRFMAFLRLNRLFCGHKLSEAMQEAARAAGAGLKITKIPDFSNLSKNDLVLIEENWLTPSETEAVLAHDSAVMAIDPGKELRETLENMKCDGIVFTGTHTVIAMPREATAQITYTCLLP